MSFVRETSPKNFQSVTLGEWLDLCLEVYMKHSLKQSTYLSYESYIRIHFKPALGGLLLRDLSPRLLQQFYNYKAEGEGLAPKTIVNINLFLHKALSYAVNEGFIQTNPNGGFIEPRTFKDYYNEILRIAGLRHFTFHALRHTFASRAMEQGMDAKTLSMILGHYSVSFTLDTYTHVLDEHKHEGMALMGDLFNDTAPQSNDAQFPVVMTLQNDGSMDFEIPGVPQITHTTNDVQMGIQLVKESLQEEILVSPMPLIPCPAEYITLAPNQVLMNVKV